MSKARSAEKNGSAGQVRTCGLCAARHESGGKNRGGGAEVQSRKRVPTPWGWWQVLAQGPGWKIKQLHVKGGGETSLQRHRFRDELWWIRSRGSGSGLEGAQPLFVSRLYYVPRGTAHRLTGPLEVLELQQGQCRESDIVRLEDKYGRA